MARKVKIIAQWLIWVGHPLHLQDLAISVLEIVSLVAQKWTYRSKTEIARSEIIAPLIYLYKFVGVVWNSNYSELLI
jgi:hypothetical protein